MVEPDEEEEPMTEKEYPYQRPMTEEEYQELDSADLLAALESAHAIGIPVETDEQRMVWWGFF